MKVIVLTGMPGSGKEEFVQVAKEAKYEVVRMGDVVRAEAASRSIARDDKSVGGFASSERQGHGYDIWAKRCVPHVRARNTVIDGSRGVEELEVFRNAFGRNVRLVAIHSSPVKRFPRLQLRGRPDAPQTWEEFVERDRRELGWGLGDLIALADVMLINEGTLEEFRATVKGFLTGQV